MESRTKTRQLQARAPVRLNAQDGVPPVWPWAFYRTAPGQVRQAVDSTYAIQTNAPAGGSGLFRTSTGHGGLQCAACHGSAHVELASSQSNDNAENQQLQGHAGTLVECSVCHPTVPSTFNGGPHGLHPVGTSWVSGHRREGRSNRQCQDCHGVDYRGTVLGKSFDAGRHWPCLLFID